MCIWSIWVLDKLFQPGHIPEYHGEYSADSAAVAHMLRYRMITWKARSLASTWSTPGVINWVTPHWWPWLFSDMTMEFWPKYEGKENIPMPTSWILPNCAWQWQNHMDLFFLDISFMQMWEMIFSHLLGGTWVQNCSHAWLISSPAGLDAGCQPGTIWTL